MKEIEKLCFRIIPLFIFFAVQFSGFTSTSEVIFKKEIKVTEDSLFQKGGPIKFKRGKAILFTVLTGILGGHRIYLRTHHRTPIIYAATLGGLGILPLIDLVHIIFTKDLSRYENNSQIIMWKKE